MSDEQFKQVMARLDTMQAQLGDVMEAIRTRRTARPAASAPSTAGGAHGITPAPAVELDSKYGDPVVKFKPNKWTGEDFVGSDFSECSAEFLEMLGEALAYSATHPKPGKEQYIEYNRKDAARAFGWAARIRAGGGTPRTADGLPVDDDVPF